MIPVLVFFGLMLQGAASGDETAIRNRLLIEQRALLSSRDKEGRVEENLRHLAGEKSEALAQLENLATIRTELEEERQRLLEREDQLREDWEESRRRAVRRLVQLARRGDSGALEMLLTSGGPAEFVYRYHALRMISRADQELFAELERRHEAYADNRDRLDAQEQILRDMQSQAERELTRLQVLEELRHEQLAAVRNEVREREAWVESMREAVESLGIMVEAIEPRSTATASRALYKPIQGNRTAAFGSPDPMVGNLLPSQGWRYQAPAGEPVIATAPGVVAYADWFQGLGNLVILEHGAGTSTLYAHLDLIRVEPGDLVEGGVPIGSAGTSGAVSEAGLYFQVRRDGLPVDPATWLTDAREAASGR